MTEIEVWAFNIIKGELNGDEYLWDQHCVDPKTGVVIQGVWKSYYEQNKSVVVAEER